MDTEPAKSPLAELSAARKSALLLLFCVSQFLDSFNVAALFSGIPVIATRIGLNDGRSVWLNSAYQLTLAAFLLISGRMSDIYNPKIVFLCGVYLLGFLSLGIGFARNDVVVLVLRALCGIGAAMSIPSALHLIIHTFPDPIAQAKAVTAFGGSGAIGNVLGVILGALIISFASWPWVFYMASIIALVVAIISTFLIPNQPVTRSSHSRPEQFRKLDLFGSSLLIIALVLFIFAVTSGSTDGWKTATVLVPLFLSIILFVLFFLWEARIPEDQASLPPRMWSYPNFTSLALLGLLPYTWWGTVYLLFAWFWQEVQGWSAIDAGVHFLPLGLVAFPVMALSSVLQQKLSAKYIILGGLVILVAGTVFLPFADSAHRYWPIAFPGFVLGTAGTTIVYATTNIAIFAATPPEVAGTVGAVFNCALQLGSAVFTSVATSIQTSVQPSPESFKGRAAAFEFLIGIVALQFLSVLLFVRKTGLTVSTNGPKPLGDSEEGLPEAK